MPTNALLLTVLPNGLTDDGTHLRVTVLVTPIADSGSLTSASPFFNWPGNVGNLTWQLGFQPLNAPLAPSTIPLPATPPATPFSQNANLETAEPLNSSLWKAIFGENRSVLPRRGNAAFAEAWRLSHDISTLNDHHQVYRLFHAERRLLSSALKRAANAVDAAKTPRDLQTAQGHRTAISTAYQSVESAIAAGTPPILYIYPPLGNDNGTYSANIAARNAALNFINDAIDAANVTEAQVIKNRIQYAVNLLEHNTLPDKDAKQPHQNGKFAKDSEKLRIPVK